MKKLLSLTMAMMMLFSTTAFAKTIDGVDIGDKTIYKQDETDQKYDVTFTGAVNGKEYMLWVVKNIHATAKTASFAQADVLYINQATAANNQVTFNDFLPMNIENSTLLISGQGMAEPDVVGYIAANSEVVLKGDVDNDGDVDNVDAARLLRYVLNAMKDGETIDMEEAKVTDGDTDIDMDDVVALKGIIASTAK